MKMKFITFLGAISLFICYNSIGQQRQIDLKVEVVSPASNSVIQPSAAFTVVAKITNNGPDTLISGDSLFSQSTLDENPELGTIRDRVLPGESFEIDLELTNTNKSGTDQTAEFCIFFFNDPSTQISTANNNPVFVSYVDNDSTNNFACLTLTLKTEPKPNSTNDILVNASDLKTYPNPAISTLSFDLTSDNYDDVIITVIDITGKPILNKNLGKSTAGINQTFSIDLSEINVGNYILNVKNSNNVYNSKFTVAK